MSGNNTDTSSDVAAMRVEHKRMKAELEELRREAANNNKQFDPNRPLRDFTAPDPETIQLGYQRPNICQPYQIPPGWMAIVQQNQFHGHAHEDAVQHLLTFGELCQTLNIDAISEENIKLMTFTFSLADKAKSWIRGQRAENMNTWRKMSLAFLNRFFPPSKTNAIRHQIYNFTQKRDESMAEAWERFNEIQ